MSRRDSAIEASDEKTLEGNSARNSRLYDSKERQVPANRDAGSTTELVVFKEDDPEDPKNWPHRKKVGVVSILCILSFVS